MARDDDGSIAADMDDSELTRGVADALDEATDNAEKEIDREEGKDTTDDADTEGDVADDDQPVDDDDDLVDDDDDLDEGDEQKPETDQAAAPITREDGATWDTGKNQWRQKDGTFVAGEAPKVAPAKGEATEAKPGEAVVAKPDAEKPVVAGEPKWEPFSVQADKKAHAIEGAIVQKKDGHVFVAMPDDKFAAFQLRIGRGIVAERLSRELDTQLRNVAQIQKDLTERQTHPEPTAEQIEAATWLEALKAKGVLAEVFEQHELDNLELKVKLALHDAKEKYTKDATDRRTAAAEAPEALGAQQLEGLSLTLVQVASDPDFAELNGLTDQQLKEVFEELKPVMSSLYFREKDEKTGKFEWYANVEYIHRALTAKAKGAASAAAPVKTGQPVSATAADKAEAFNAGVDGAKKPPSTSVKAGAPKPGNGRPSNGNRSTKRDDRRPRDTRTEDQRDEDAVRAEMKKFMASPTLDY